MREDTLRLPTVALASNSTPNPNPTPNRASAVESWLDGVASTVKPSPDEFSQWQADKQPQMGRGVYITILCFRILSTIFAFATSVLVGIAMSWGWTFAAYERMLPSITVCPIITALNLANFITMAALSGKAIPPRFLVWADGLFALMLPITAALYIWKIYNFWPYLSYRAGVMDVVAAAGLLILMFTHWFLFLFYWCSGLSKAGKKRKGGTQPMIMYLTSGQPVVVTPAPIRPMMPPPVERVQLPTPHVQIHQPPQPALAGATQASPAGISPISPAVTDGFREPFRQGVPPRKPVAGTNVGTHYASPWPTPDYQPDEAEKARAARGERQAQWMTLHGMGLRGDEKSGLGVGLGGMGHDRVEAENSSTRKARRLSV
ncbi:hypothetical protein QBC34DRAFT_146047 [Podospora aff. communis PSN243]|uniref:MARVEL domain-containing protein n=1 Tax=Podospora aff. communis PSN243 TaxID=3040156 RepID=A0AAV9GEI4_9PEZI|nr:hypothetical protein QBC34DRAFT_146047 [Podospora aff. communis PSN243]